MCGFNKIKNNHFQLNFYSNQEGNRLKNLAKSKIPLDYIVECILSYGPPIDENNHLAIRKIYLINKAIEGEDENSYSFLNKISNFFYGSPINRAEKIVEQLKSQLYDLWKDVYWDGIGWSNNRFGWEKPPLYNIECLIESQISDAQTIIETPLQLSQKGTHPTSERLSKINEKALYFLKNAKILLKLFPKPRQENKYLKDRIKKVSDSLDELSDLSSGKKEIVQDWRMAAEQKSRQIVFAFNESLREGFQCYDMDGE